MHPPPLLSIVVPAFNEERNLAELVARLRRVLAELGETYEIVVVDDGSSDASFAVLQALHSERDDLRAIRLSRNFGHQAALLAGLRAARGNAVITLDADLQHPPELIAELVAKWRQGFRVVHTLRRDAPGTLSPIKRVTAWVFYSLFRMFSGLPMQAGMADFRLVDRSALNAALASDEARVFLRGMFVWVGYRQTCVAYDADPRRQGTSGYSLTKMLRLAVHGLLAFSEVPLYWSFALGALLCATSFAYGLYAIGIRLLTDNAVPGWASVVTLVAFLLGLQMVFLGLVGSYVGAIYAEVKHRPAFIVAEEHPPTTVRTAKVESLDMRHQRDE